MTLTINNNVISSDLGFISRSLCENQYNCNSTEINTRLTRLSDQHLAHFILFRHTHNEKFNK